MKRILVIAPLSPPITGQQQASNELVHTLRRWYSVKTLDYSKSSFRQGNFSLERTAAILAVVGRTWRRSRRAEVTYLTVSQSLLGNLRDLLIVAFCRSPAIILHLHGSGIGRLIFRRYPLLRIVNRAVCRKVHRVIVLSASLRDNYQGVVPGSRIAVIPGFVDDIQPDAALLHHENERTRVLYLSNMIAEKGYKDLLDGYLQLDASDQARIDLDFVGKFDEENAEADFRRRLRGLPAVRYLGAVSATEKANLLSSAHVLCLPSYYPYEGQPVVILEAYSHGCIVLTTAQGGIPDIFEDGVNGLRVEPKSAASIAGRLHEILEMPFEDRKRIARTNVRYARESFSRVTFEHNVLGLFDTVLDEAAPSSTTKTF